MPKLREGYREFYEEKVERELNEKYSARIKNYRRARKQFLRREKLIKIVKNKRTIDNTGPRWYQELSVNQIDILDKFRNSMRNDYDVCTSQYSKHAIKTLGVRTFIPDTVATYAKVVSELDPVFYLMEIKNYVMKMNNRVQIGQNNNAVKYSVDVRILMTGIVYLEFPNLIKRLDYCLPKPVPDKMLKYIRLPKRTLIKYDSPYLEPLPEPIISRTEEKKIQWHNMKVKKQKMSEQLKVIEQQKLQKTETENENSIKARMKIEYPEHPLQKMLYRPPLMLGSIQEDEELIIESHSSESIFFEMEEEDTWSLEEMDGGRDPIKMPVRSSSLFTFSDSESSQSTMSVIEQLPSSSSSSSGREESTDRLPYGWLKADLSVPYDPASWADQSSSDDDWLAEKKALNVTQTAIDIDSANYETSTSSVNGRTGSNAEYGLESDGEDDKDDNSDVYDRTEDDGEDNQDTDDGKDGLCGRAWPAMDERDRRVWRVFGVDGMPFVTKDRTPSSSNTSARSLQSSTVFKGSGGKRENVFLERKQTVLNVVSTNESTDSGSVESLPHSSNASAEQSRQPSDSEKAGNLLDEQLDVIRNLPLKSQLNATLEFLSNMGDPIAGFPELTKLYNLQIWYQKRLNINRHMTSKYKQNLMDKSVTIWKVPVPKLTTVTIPKLKLKSNTLTWGQISSTKQEIKRAKAEYTTNLKRTAIDNARNMYLSTYNDYFENGLNKNFKRTFFAYFPAKEDDCMFENPPKIFNEKA